MLAAALVVTSAHALANEQEQLEDLQTSDAPLRVEDAMTQQQTAQGQAVVRGSNDDGEEGLFLQPMVEVPITDSAEVTAQFEMGQTADGSQLGPLELSAAQKLVKEEGLRPAITARVTGITPHEDVGIGGRLTLLATEKVTENLRAHLNTAYTAQRDAGDRYHGGLGADYAMNENFMVTAGTWAERLREEAQTVLGYEGGAAMRLGPHFVFHAVAGAMRTDDGTVPRLGVALTAQ